MTRTQMVGQLEMLRMELDDLLRQKCLIDVLVDDAARQFQELQTEIAVAERKEYDEAGNVGKAGGVAVGV